MHGAIRAAGFSLMTMFVSCGVGAQELDTRIGKIAMESELPAHESIAKPYAPTEPFRQALKTRRHHSGGMTPSVH
jgi:pyruvate/oxaloacetate carboxyltransferase